MGNRGRLKTDLEYTTTYLLVSGLGLLPRSFAVRLGQVLGWTTYHLSRKLRQTGETNLKLALPHLGRSEHERILLGCFISLGRQLGIFSHLSRLNSKNLLDLIDCEGLENLDTARTNAHGVILFTGHLGAWELTSVALSLLGYPVSFLVRRLVNPKIE